MKTSPLLSRALLVLGVTVTTLVLLNQPAFRALAEATGLPPQHERLRVRNTFQKPDEVVKYYVGRDSSGFVWSGLLEIERKAFTLWKDLPTADSFYIAENYEIAPAKVTNNEATVEVHYKIKGVGDAHGTVMPSQEPDRRVTFRLRKDAGTWKIAEPESGVVSPVVLAAKFPYAQVAQAAQ